MRPSSSSIPALIREPESSAWEERFALQYVPESRGNTNEKTFRIYIIKITSVHPFSDQINRKSSNFPLYRDWEILSLCYFEFDTDKSTLIHFSQYLSAGCSHVKNELNDFWSSWNFLQKRFERFFAYDSPFRRYQQLITVQMYQFSFLGTTLTKYNS